MIEKPLNGSYLKVREVSLPTDIIVYNFKPQFQESRLLAKRAPVNHRAKAQSTNAYARIECIVVRVLPLDKINSFGDMIC